jgi:NhaP-type Na+/H+ or K+/H+ antiporter
MTLTLHPAIKSFLTISAKNAVFAILTNSALMLQWHSIFNFDNWPGVWAVARATFAVIASREALVWLPKLLKWSQTDADASDLQSALEHAAAANKQTQSAAREVSAAIAEAKQEAPKQ